jgi:hypothetical protein
VDSRGSVYETLISWYRYGVVKDRVEKEGIPELDKGTIGRLTYVVPL